MIKNSRQVVMFTILTLIIFFTTYEISVYRGTIYDYRFMYRDADSIHFLNTGHSDCIIIKSNDEYALVDCGFGRDYIDDIEKPTCDTLIPYLKKLSNGKKIHIKYAIATHTHIDHLSGYLDLLDSDDVIIDKFIIKERNKTCNKKVYNKVMDKLNNKNIPIEHNVDNLKIKLGNFKLDFYNGELAEPTSVGDNDNSLAILVTHKKIKTLLSGDICNINKDEERIAPLIGDIDILKVPHHGHYNSTSESFMKIIKPEIAIVTNREFTSKTVKERLTKYCPDNTYLTVEENGMVVVFEPRIRIYNNSCRT